jgi:exonuclease III
MKSHIHILSLNINGLREDGRCKNIFYWLKQLNYDIILLQDVRCHDNEHVTWSLEWGLPALWSYHNAVLLMNKTLSILKVSLLSEIT